MTSYKHLIASFKSKKILVLGDVILDQHIRGTVSRVSPEAPVPIVLQDGEPTYSPGGAANVASNLKSLGANVTLVGRIGSDNEGKIFLSSLKKNKISTKGIFKDQSIPTIIKTRIVAHHQQVLRLDREQNNDLSSKTLNKLQNFLTKNIGHYDAIILSDYGKGLLSKALIEFTCDLSRREKKIITVDPKVEHFSYYEGVTSITPNRKEAENAIRNIKITHSASHRLGLNSDCLKTLLDVERAGQQLLKFLKLESLLITLGEQGMCVFEKGQKSKQIFTRAREVFDVTGAGDTVIAVFTLALSVGATKFQAADLANYAAGIVVGKMGAVAVTRDELFNAVKHHGAA
ncbi:MAG: D-glycero-beta-D-manno-heptose-7-phosphate kinase [Candidatus Omnitrophica bacterium]|nr:D-glycero-beta-D-manno-heptose-7-phosphate kinase [Candidatus Omnitrophota bacterium]